MKNSLKRIREDEFKMTLMDFAIFLGVHYNTYRNWEAGQSQPPLEVAFSISKKLGRLIEDIWQM